METKQKTKMTGKYLRAYLLLKNNPAGITIRDIISFANSPHAVIKKLRDEWDVPISDEQVKKKGRDGKLVTFKRYFLERKDEQQEMFSL